MARFNVAGCIGVKLGCKCGEKCLFECVLCSEVKVLLVGCVVTCLSVDVEVTGIRVCLVNGSIKS